MSGSSRKLVDISITVECELTDGWGGERWDVVSVTEDSTGESLGDIGIYEFDAYSDFVGAIADAVRDTYFDGIPIDTDKIYVLDITIRHGGSVLGTSVTRYRGKHPCAP
jgi:hypothetical protein